MTNTAAEPPLWRAIADRENRPAAVLAAIIAIAGLFFAWKAAWTCDDAFISFRYARHLVENGELVFNPGERVEGFTNLLWTLWIAVGLAVGAPAAGWATAWGLAFYAGVLVLLGRFHLELCRRLGAPRFSLPLGALVAALHPDYHVFATSGLETSAFTFAAFLGYTIVVRGAADERPRPVSAGIALGLCSLLRPDGTLFLLLGAGVLLLGRSRRDVLVYAAVSGSLFLGSTLWRIGYYGDFFPNTYYAKSASLTWHAQGLRYLELYLLKYGPLLVPWFGAALVMARAREDETVLGDGRRWFSIHAFAAAAFAVVYGYSIVRVGGDFMYARMLIPITPYLAVLFELGLFPLTRIHPALHSAAALLLLGAMLLSPRPVAEEVWDSGVTDERAFYSPARIEEAERHAADLAPYMKGLDVRVAFVGTQARVMYRARVPVAIEAETGLTDRAIAHQPLHRRGRIGHEKHADLDYLIRERKADLAIGPAVDHVLGLRGAIPVMTVGLGSVDAYVLRWNPPLVNELRRRGARVPDFIGALDAYAKTLDTRPRKEVLSAYARYRRFYFDHHPDLPREARFEERLARP